MTIIRKFIVLAGLFATALGAVAEPMMSMPGAVFRGAPPPAAALQLGFAAPARELLLAPVNAAESAVAAKSAAASADKRTPLQIGFARALPSGSSSIDLAGLQWQDTGGGRSVARITVTSPGASALRTELGFIGDAGGLLFRFGGSADGAPAFGPFSWADLERAARWSPVVEGSTAIIEMEAAAGVALAGKRLILPRVSHLTVSGADLAPDRLKRVGDIGRSGSCNIDIACISNPSNDLLLASAAVAQIAFTDGGSTFLCTGSLINSGDAAGNAQQIPYFVTANHCIGNALSASTINFYWFFQAATCNSLAVPNFQVTAGGASLLYSSYDVDLTLLRLNNNPPAGASLAGWDASPVFPGSGVISLHHPNGDLKKYSSGNAMDFAHDFDDVQSPGNFVPQGSYLRIHWLQGTTEVGSSGSGVYTRAAGGPYQLRGVLHGGDASCQDINGLDYFARLDLAYPSISTFLAGVVQPAAGNNAIEYYNVDLDHYFITSFADEARAVDAGSAGRGWLRTGYSFPIVNVQSPPNVSVCRFYGNPNINPATGTRRGPNSHFYTADAKECAQVKLDPGWTYEAIAFAIQVPVGGACPANTTPVFRLYNKGFATNNSNHRYTTSSVIYQFMLTQNWSGEQTVMCAPG